MSKSQLSTGGFGTLKGAENNNWLEAVKKFHGVKNAKMVYDKKTREVNWAKAKKLFPDIKKYTPMKKVKKAKPMMNEEIFNMIYDLNNRLDMLESRFLGEDRKETPLEREFEKQLREGVHVELEPIEEVLNTIEEVLPGDRSFQEEKEFQSLLGQVGDLLEGSGLFGGLLFGGDDIELVEPSDYYETMLEEYEDEDEDEPQWDKALDLCEGIKNAAKQFGGKRKRKKTEWQKAMKMAGSMKGARMIYNKKTKKIDIKKAKKLGFL